MSSRLRCLSRLTLWSRSCLHCLLLCGLCLLLAGCGLGRSPVPTYYALGSPVPLKIESGRLTGPRVAVGPLTLPGYLDRNALFTRSAQNPEIPEVLIREQAQWSEPLTDGVVRVLCAGISRRLSNQDGMAFPLHAAIPATWRLSVDMTRFDGAPGGEVTLETGWTLATALGDVFYMGRHTDTIPCGPELADMVNAQSTLLDRFAEALTKEILAAETNGS